MVATALADGARLFAQSMAVIKSALDKTSYDAPALPHAASAALP
jgi:hypothetical protein